VHALDLVVVLHDEIVRLAHLVGLQQVATPHMDQELLVILLKSRTLRCNSLLSPLYIAHQWEPMRIGVLVPLSKRIEFLFYLKNVCLLQQLPIDGVTLILLYYLSLVSQLVEILVRVLFGILPLVAAVLDISCGITRFGCLTTLVDTTSATLHGAVVLTGGSTHLWGVLVLMRRFLGK